MVECGGLENRCRRKMTGGSNPPLSVVSTSREKPSNPNGRWLFVTSRKETTDSGGAPAEPESISDKFRST